MTYRIRTVSEMTGIPRNTLIAWERRYGFVKPERHGNSYRSYSEADIAKLMQVKSAIESGLSVSEAIAMLSAARQVANDGTGATAALDSGAEGTPLPGSRLEPLGDAAGMGRYPALAPPFNAVENERELGAFDPFREIRTKLFDALTRYQAGRAERLLASLVSVSSETRIHRIFFPILRAIGDGWQKGELSVAQEHYAAALIREQMIGILMGLGQEDERRPHAASTSFPEDTHELAALAMAVRLSHAGYRVSYLGPNLPVSELGGFCRASEPSLVCVSAIMKQEATTIVDYARSLREAVPEQVRLVIGGCGVDVEPQPRVAGVELRPKWEDFST